MPTPTKTQDKKAPARKRKATNNPNGRPAVVDDLKARLDAKPDTPLLAVIGFGDYHPTHWGHKLKLLIDRGIPAPVLAHKLGLGTSAVYKYIDPEGAPRYDREKMDPWADALGIPADSWHWPIDEFATWVDRTYGLTGGNAGSNGSSTWSDGQPDPQEGQSGGRKDLTLAA